HTIQKHLDLDWSREIVKATSAAGIRPVTGFIAGYPMETRETFRDTLMRYFEFLDVGGYRSHIFTLKPYHEAPLYKKYGSGRFDRASEYFELHLTGESGEECREMKAAHPEIFSTYFRYATPEIDDSLVDATEEISAQLVLLRGLWPLLLKYYDTPLDFFEGWANWIGEYNAIHRAGTPYRHQSDVEDLLTFIESEIERLGCGEDAELTSMFRYEKLKISARGLAPLSVPVAGIPVVDENTVVQNGRSYVAAEFEHDISPLVSGQKRRENGEKKWVLVTNSGEQALAFRRWVLVAKADGASLNTYHLGERAMRLLELAAEPGPVSELIERAVAAEGDAAYGRGDYLRLVQSLVGLRLMQPVA
ncbi:MAG: hypothetical protein ACLGI9_20095, partial [Thermoanaerobaculia bacterium]